MMPDPSFEATPSRTAFHSKVVATAADLRVEGSEANNTIRISFAVAGTAWLDCRDWSAVDRTAFEEAIHICRAANRWPQFLTPQLKNSDRAATLFRHCEFRPVEVHTWVSPANSTVSSPDSDIIKDDPFSLHYETWLDQILRNAPNAGIPQSSADLLATWASSNDSIFAYSLFAGLDRCGSVVMNTTQSVVEYLAVVPDRRRLGYGRRLLQHAIHVQASRQCRLWSLKDNQQAHLFYGSVGWTIAERNQLWHSGRHIQVTSATANNIKG